MKKNVKKKLVNYLVVWVKLCKFAYAFEQYQ